jgi:hypothetical protein
MVGRKPIIRAQRYILKQHHFMLPRHFITAIRYRQDYFCPLNTHVFLPKIMQVQRLFAAGLNRLPALNNRARKPY